MNGTKNQKNMKVIVEDITEEVKAQMRTQKPHKKKVEIPVDKLWEDEPMIFTPEDEILPDKWDFQVKKVKL